MKNKMKEAKIFNEWPERYDRWFETPIGKLILSFESKLLIEMLRPKPGEWTLDAGCGTGGFTRCLLEEGPCFVGLDISFPMLFKAGKKLARYPFSMVQGDMGNLPFADNQFDKTISVTTIEFIVNARNAIDQLFRVTRPGGSIVVATLNSLSPWATRRKVAGEKGHPIFKNVIFRSPKEMNQLASMTPLLKTAIHFQKHDKPLQAQKIEEWGRSIGADTGAFLVARWKKPV